MDGNDGKTIVTAQRTENGVDLGIDKAGSRDSGLQVIQANHVYRATKPVEGILDTTDEGLQILPPDDLLIRVAGITQHSLNRWGRRYSVCVRAAPKSTCMSRPGGVSTRAKTRDSRSFLFDGVIRSIEAMLQCCQIRLACNPSSSFFWMKRLHELRRPGGRLGRFCSPEPGANSGPCRADELFLARSADTSRNFPDSGTFELDSRQHTD